MVSYFPPQHPEGNILQNVILLWFIEGKQSTEKPGGAHCGESRMMRFEWECQRVISGSTPNKQRNNCLLGLISNQEKRY